MPGPSEQLRQVLVRLGHEASVEINVQDLSHLDESRSYLPAGARVYVSHLPKQTFAQTLNACSEVKAAGFDPIPHVPVRLLESHEELNQLVSEAAETARELLLISGDYARANGPFTNVADVLRACDWRARGIERVSIGGHPEGHTTVALDEIRRAEWEKVHIARDLGLDVNLVTQFFFESAPFLRWAQMLSSTDTSVRITAGLAGPAKITTLLRFAVRCGVGPSIKALGSRPGAFTRLLGEHGPEHLLKELAEHALERTGTFQGIHMFCFGGFLRTCRWLNGLAAGDFVVNGSGEWMIHETPAAR